MLHLSLNRLWVWYLLKACLPSLHLLAQIKGYCKTKRNPFRGRFKKLTTPPLLYEPTSGVPEPRGFIYGGVIYAIDSLIRFVDIWLREIDKNERNAFYPKKNQLRNTGGNRIIFSRVDLDILLTTKGAEVVYTKMSKKYKT